MEFGDVVTYYLKEKGMTAKQLADKSGLTESYISQVRSGRSSDPTFSRAVAVIQALDVDIDEFMDRYAYSVVDLSGVEDEHPEAQDR